MSGVVSPYLNMDLGSLAAAASRDALRGGSAGGDPVLAVLYLEAGQFTHGACALMASHLNESRGMPVILIQGRPPGQDWMTRHTMACPGGKGEAIALIKAGRGVKVRVLDAAGGGLLGDRLELYRQRGWDYRAIMATDPDCSAHWMWVPSPPEAALESGGHHLQAW